MYAHITAGTIDAVQSELAPEILIPLGWLPVTEAERPADTTTTTCEPTYTPAGGTVTQSWVEVPKSRNQLDAEAAEAALLQGAGIGNSARFRHQAGILRHKLSMNTPATWVHLGDSTGDGTDEWLRLALPVFAADYPNMRVTHELWNDTTQAYDTATVVQAGIGAGAPTFRVVNGSMPGASTAYLSLRIPLMVPTEPDLLTISSSHNHGTQTGATYETNIVRLVNDVLALYPDAGVAVSSQNPRFPPVSEGYIAAQAARLAAIRPLTALHGWGYIEAAEQFLMRADRGQSWVNVDGIHPTLDGSTAWKNAALQYLRG